MPKQGYVEFMSWEPACVLDLLCIGGSHALGCGAQVCVCVCVCGHFGIDVGLRATLQAWDGCF